MENEQNKSKYMSLGEYESDFVRIGGDDFLNYLQQKLQEARESGDYELVEHINRIYDDALDSMTTEYIVEGGEFEADDISMLRYEEELDRFELPEIRARYEAILEEIAQEEKKIDEINTRIEALDDDRESYLEEIELANDRTYIDRYISLLQEKAKILQYKIRLEELRTSITQMSQEEIEEYSKLFSEKQGYLDTMEQNIYAVSPSSLRFADKALELVEGHRTKNSQVAESEKEEQPEQLTEDLSSLSIEELIQRFNSNNLTITNNEQAIKHALIQKILGQQQQIADQTAEIDRLKSQKEL